MNKETERSIEVRIPTRQTKGYIKRVRRVMRLQAKLEAIRGKEDAGISEEIEAFDAMVVFVMEFVVLPDGMTHEEAVEWFEEEVSQEEWDSILEALKGEGVDEKRDAEAEEGK